MKINDIENTMSGLYKVLDAGVYSAWGEALKTLYGLTTEFTAREELEIELAESLTLVISINPERSNSILVYHQNERDREFLTPYSYPAIYRWAIDTAQEYKRTFYGQESWTATMPTKILNEWL